LYYLWQLQCVCLLTSYTCRPLLEGLTEENIATNLYNAPFVLLSHNAVGSHAAAVRTFANENALKTWETTWEEFVGDVSSTCAEAEETQQQVRNLRN
jgi:hypothetical protein